MTDVVMSPVDGHAFNASDIALCGRVADKLNKHYPGHLWATHLNSDSLGGVVVIRNLAVSTKYGYVLKLSTIYQDPDLKCVMRAGGEILERAKLSQRGLGQVARHVDGLRPQDQPFNGVVS